MGNERMRERMAFLSKPEEELRAVRGRELYDALGALDLNHGHYFRALGVSFDEYCAREFGIDVGRITVDRFFQSDPNAKWLFPDLVREAVVAGMTRKPVYPQLIVRDEPVDGSAYDVPYVAEDAENEELRDVAEGAAIPESEITYGDRIVRLDKKGRGVIASYEVVRRMAVDMLRVHLRRMGERLGRTLDARLAQVLVSGDSSGSATAAETLNTETPEKWTYDDLLRGYMKLSVDHYFTPTHVVANADTCRALLQMEPFQDAAVSDFAATGNWPTPLGARLVPLAEHPANAVTLLDAGYAVSKLTEQDLLVESDKLISRQWDRTYLTVVTDFAVIYEKARVVINSDWEEE